MTMQIETAHAAENTSGWQRLWMWLADFAQAMEFDPHEYTDARIEHLKNEFIQLNARLDAAEGRNQSAA